MSIAVIGLLAGAGLGVWRSASERLDELRAESFLKVVQQALLGFAHTSYRLPCPDTTGDGYENCNSGRSGRVPFYTLGMELGGNVSNVGNSYENLLYGVYRAANANGSDDADLTQLIERTNDAAPTSGSEIAAPDLDDFRRALMNAANDPLSPRTNEVHVTGDGSTTGAANCSTNQVTNLAFILISGGARDRDGDNNVFDGQNATWQANGGGSLCAGSPLLRLSATYDDLIIAESFQSVLSSITPTN